MATIELPYPPSANRYWRSIGRGRVLVSEEGRRFRSLVAAEWLAHPERHPPLEGRVGVRLAIYVPDNRRRDVDNVLKPTLDALTHAGVWVDDSQVDDLHIRRGHLVEGGALVVEVWSINNG